MKNIGPILVILFSVLILGAMFIPYARGFDGNQNFWVLTSGADIALALVCVLALGCAIGALLIKVGFLRTLAAVFGGLACGVIWAFTANVLSDTEGTKGGFWILSVLGVLLLLSAIVAAVTSGSEESAAARPAPAGGLAGPQAPAARPYTPPAASPSPAAPAPAAKPSHPEGWYRDPAGGNAERYWDGTRWTDQFRTPGS